MGGMCARVCPTEVLCEQACVRKRREGKPVRSGCCSGTPPTGCSSNDDSAVSARAGDRQARRRGRRRPGRAVLRAPPGHARASTSTVFEAQAEARRPERVRHRRLQDAARLRAARGRLHPRHRRHRSAYRAGARPRRRAGACCGATTTRCSSASAWPAPRPGLRRRRPGRRRGRRRVHRALRQAARAVEAAGRPRRRRDRRRHDRHRHRGAGEAPRRRGGDHRLPARPEAMAATPARAGVGAEQRRAHQALGAARAPDRQRGPASRRRVRVYPARLQRAG